MSALKGHCQCGAVKYTCSSEPVLVGYDHCDQCQRQVGSTYSLVAVVHGKDLKIDGNTKEYVTRADSGAEVSRVFCPTCGSPIWHGAKVKEAGTQKFPDLVALKAGTLDMDIKQKLVPDTEIWTKTKLSFCQENLKNKHTGMP